MIPLYLIIRKVVIKRMKVNKNPMKSFKQLCEEKGLTFDSVKMADVVGETIEVHGYKIVQSEEHGSPFVVLDAIRKGVQIKITGGCAVLEDKLAKLADHMPYKAKIVKNSRYYDFA